MAERLKVVNDTRPETGAEKQLREREAEHARLAAIHEAVVAEYGEAPPQPPLDPEASNPAPVEGLFELNGRPLVQ